MILHPDKFNLLIGHLPLHTKWVIATAFYTGMRRGEIKKITWPQVSLGDRVIRLEAKDTKDKEPRSIPICDELYAILNEIPKAIHDNCVFLYKGKAVGDIRKSLKRACEKLGIPYGRDVEDRSITCDLR